MASCDECGHEVVDAQACAFCGAPATGSATEQGAASRAQDAGSPTGPHPAGSAGSAYLHGVSTLDKATVRHIGADVIAAVLLLVSLVLPWDYAGRGYGRWYVDLAVAVSLLSLALPWLLRDRLVLLKRLLALPAAVCVLTAVITDLASFGAIRHHAGPSAPHHGGVGSAVGLLAAGAIAAALPRDRESLTARTMAGTRLLTIVLGALGALCALAATVANQFPAGGWVGAPAGMRYATAVTTLVPLIVWATALVSSVTGPRHGRPTLVALAAMNALLAIMYVDPRGPLRLNLPPVETLSQTVYGDCFFLAAGVAAAAYWSSTRPPGDADSWLGAARLCFLISALALALTGVQALANGVALRRAAEFDTMSLSRILTVSVCCLVAAAIAGAVGWMLRDRSAAPRLALGGWIVLVGMGIVILAINIPTDLVPLASPMAAACFTIPLAAVGCVVLPDRMRAEQEDGATEGTAPPAQ